MAKNNSPAFQFYPNDWLSSPKVMLMTPAEEGAYIRLLAISWTNGGLPDDDEQLALLSRLGKGWLGDASTKIKACFVKKGSVLVNERLEKEALKQKRWREKSSAGGKASGKARQQKKLQKEKETKGGLHLVQTNEQPNSNTSFSHFSEKDKGANFSKENLTPLQQEAAEAFDFNHPAEIKKRDKLAKELPKRSELGD